ncbi:hypothetical protein BH11PSE7_BH11PSE7_17840 [soil metagenome]
MALPNDKLEFLNDGGDMGALVRSYPWDGHTLGTPHTWPRGLRMAIRVMLTTQHPVFIFWGPDHICFYNDAYSESLGPEKHPSILGMPGRQAWKEIWPDIEPQIDHVLQAKGSTWHKDQLLPIIRRGGLQEVYWTYSYSPIDEPAYPHGIGGVLVICSETTDHILSTRKLSEERGRFLQLFDQAPTFLALLDGPEHVVRLANAGYLELIGHRPVIGLPVAVALPEIREQGYVEILDEVYRSGQPFTAAAAKYEAPALRDSPPIERYVDFVYQPMTNDAGQVSGILVQGVDVTARTTADRALTLSRSRLDYATRLSGVGFWYCDLPFDELQWDERVKDHFFYLPEDRVTIDDFYARIHEEDREPTRQAIADSIASRSPYDIVYRTVHPKTGQVKWIRALGGTDYASDGTPAFFDGVTVDVTAHKLDQLDLAMLNDRLRDQDRRKDEFIATLSHELRNPLSPIRAAAKVLGSPHVSPDQLQRAQIIIDRQAAHMALLLDDLLDIARITQGKLHLKKQVISLVEVVDAAVEAARPTLDAKAQKLSIEWPSHPVLLEADPLRLSQILSNLLVNAAKYSDSGSRIELAARTLDSTLELSVKDEGIGITAHAIGGIFDMFSQVDGASGMADGGIGIGLALVKGLAQLHGGDVEARSAGPGLGSEFLVRLPLVVPSKTGTTPLDGGAQAATPQRRRKILVVDDNKDAAETLALLLELEGHEVQVANLGRVALAFAQQFRPDTAVLDIGMPDISGYEVAESLRRESWGKGIQLIALTGWGRDGDRLAALKSGFDHHLSKPVDTSQLISLLDARIEHRS